jgi:4-alpha-glucanotransferase
MKQNGILSLEIQRMPKDPQKMFFNPAEAPYLSVVTPSTHDMSTIRGWWEENRERTTVFYNRELKHWGEAPYFCEAWINRAIIQQHLQSPAMWSIFQMQDLLGISETIRRQDPREERINDPANPKHYWQYRMHIDLDTLIDHAEFNDTLREMIVAAGRA